MPSTVTTSVMPATGMLSAVATPAMLLHRTLRLRHTLRPHLVRLLRAESIRLLYTLRLHLTRPITMLHGMRRPLWLYMLFSVYIPVLGVTVINLRRSVFKCFPIMAGCSIMIDSRVAAMHDGTAASVYRRTVKMIIHPMHSRCSRATVIG